MSRYRVSPQAREDLKDIHRYIARYNPVAAGRLRRLFFEKFRLLAGEPLMGQACPELRPHLRAFTVGNYVIFFVPTPFGIEVERVLHGARDLESLF